MFLWTDMFSLELVALSGKIVFYLEYDPIGQICFLWN